MRILQGLVLLFLASSFANAQDNQKLVKIYGKTFEVVRENGKNKKLKVSAPIFFRDENNKQYRLNSNQNGKYEIQLPPGEYSVFSSLPDSNKTQFAGMGKEYSTIFIVKKTDKKIKLDIFLDFVGEGKIFNKQTKGINKIK